MIRRGWITILIVALLSGVLGFGLVLYLMSDKKSAAPATQVQTRSQTDTSQTGQADNTKTQDKDDFFSRVFGGDGQALPGQTRAESWEIIIPRIIIRLTLATLLTTILAFRPRKGSPVRQRNLYVAQTQILLAVVASALMMIVGDNAARAFGIFAAVSLVRFRTNIRDPKEITVLLISLSLGLATGVGRWDLAIVLCLYVLSLLWLLESKEQEQVFRSMELTVKTRDTDALQDVLKRVFRRYKVDAELRQLDPPDEEEPLGCIMYHVTMNLIISTDQISEEIRALAPDKVDAIEWEQKKDTSFYS